MEAFQRKAVFPVLENSLEEKVKCTKLPETIEKNTREGRAPGVLNHVQHNICLVEMVTSERKLATGAERMATGKLLYQYMLFHSTAPKCYFNIKSTKMILMRVYICFDFSFSSVIAVCVCVCD